MLYRLEDNYELNSELEDDCNYRYYILHYAVCSHVYDDSHVYYDGYKYVNLKVWEL